MIRILLVIAVLIMVMVAVRRLARPGAAESNDNSPEKLVRCDHCGVYVAEQSAVSGNGRHYCSVGHRSEAEDRGN